MSSAPLSPAHVDIILNKTDQAKLLDTLETMFTSTAPSPKVDITLVDRIFILHTLQNLSNTFAEVSKVV